MVCVARGYSIVGALAVALASGCGLDLADSTADGDTDTGQTGDPGGLTGTTGDGDDEGETSGGTSPDTGSDPTGAGVDTDGGDSTGGEDDSPSSACETLDCSGGGFCDDDGSGPVCVCDPGWASTGLDCLPCQEVNGSSLPATVPAVQAAFHFEVGSETPPDSAYENSRLWLRNKASGDSVFLGATRDRDTSLLVVPGTYDVLYVHAQGTDLPLNQGAVLRQIDITDNQSDFIVDVPSATFQGAITFASGDEPANELYDYGMLWLVDPASGDRVPLGETRDDNFRLNVIPGEYEIRYEVRQTQGQAPYNRDAFLGNITITPGENNRDLEIAVTRVSGAIEFDGMTQDSLYDNGDLELIDVATGDRFPLAETEDTSFDVPLIAGVYQVVYTSRQVGERTPINKGTVVDQFEVGGGDLPHTIDIRTVVVDGSFTLNGAEPPTDAFDDGVVRLEGPSGESLTLGNTADGSFSQRVVAGPYQVIYAQDTAGISMPVNTAARLEQVEFKENTTVDIEIPVVEVVGNLTIAGSEAPDSPYDDGRLFLQNPETGDTVLLGNTREGNYAARVVPGTYDVVYKNEFSEVFLPVNQGAVVIEGVNIDGNAPLDIDVPVATLEGAVQIQGSNPSVDEGIGNLFLRDVNSGDEVFIGHTGATNFSKPLTSGTYLMEYRGVAAEGATLGASLPANENAAFACFEVLSQ
jgi:hypothetical protein